MGKRGVDELGFLPQGNLKELGKSRALEKGSCLKNCIKGTDVYYWNLSLKVRHFGFLGITELYKHALDYLDKQFQKNSSCQNTTNYLWVKSESGGERVLRHLRFFAP